MDAQEPLYVRIKKSHLVAIALVLVGLLIGLAIGMRKSTTPTTSTTPVATPVSSTSATSLTSLVSYKLPSGWRELACPAATDTVYIIPSDGPSVDCNANPTSPIVITVDAGNHTDCNQLQSVQNVSKHICISEYINGMKSLKAETRFNEQSSYKQDTTLHAYYINTGKEVVLVSYTYTNDNKYQSGWEELAKSVKKI